jgi:hypothetical protein
MWVEYRNVTCMCNTPFQDFGHATLSYASNIVRTTFLHHSPMEAS